MSCEPRLVRRPLGLVDDADQRLADDRQRLGRDRQLAAHARRELLQRLARRATRPARTICGSHSLPPFAIAAYSVAICSSVTRVDPWPMTALTACPIWKPSAFGFLRFCSRYHSSVGRKPPSSPLRPRPGRRAQPQIGAELRQPVHHARARAQLVEVDVAALHDGVVQVHRPVRLRALEAVARQLERAVALGLLFRRDQPILQRRDRRHRLERRPRVVGLAHRLVVQRLVAIGQQALLRLGRQVTRHLVGIEGRLRHHRQQPPGVDVHHDRARRRRRAQRALGDLLHLGVEGQHDVVAGHGGLACSAPRRCRGCRSWAGRGDRRRPCGSRRGRAGSRPTAARCRCGRSDRPGGSPRPSWRAAPPPRSRS